jgi:hypothetical protein
MVCNGHTGHSIETMIKEHCCHIRLYHQVKTAIAGHSINLGHQVLLDEFPGQEIQMQGQDYQGSNISCSIITSTEGIVFPWSGHGSLLFEPWSNRRRFSIYTSYILPLDPTFLYGGLENIYSLLWPSLLLQWSWKEYYSVLILLVQTGWLAGPPVLPGPIFHFIVHN